MYEAISAAGVKWFSNGEEWFYFSVCLRWNTKQGTDIEGGAIDLPRLTDSQMNFPILYITNHITEE